jgi:hypothetical protein
MIATVINRRTTAVLVSAGALLLTALAAASQADAQTLYACVNKGGAAHLFTHKPKCKKHETKLSWNVTGPAGKEGAAGKEGTDGKEGAAGKNGAAAGFGAEEGIIEYNLQAYGFFEVVPLVELKLPPGSFIVSASVSLFATSETAGAEVGVLCELDDAPTGGTLTGYQSGWGSAVTVKNTKGYWAEGEVAFHLAVSTGAKASTAVLLCGKTTEEGGSERRIWTNSGAIVAVQTSSNES